MINYNYMPLWRYLFTYCVTLVSHGMSVFGSLSLICLILRDAKHRGEVYHRLVLGMSVADLVFTGFNALQGLLLPKANNMPLAIGNTRSCEFMGAISVIWMSAVLYNAVLCVYFLLAVRYGKRQRHVKAIIEPYGHIIAIGVPLLFIAAYWSNGLFNQALILGICTVAPYPVNCFEEESVECIRGNQTPYSTIVRVHGSFNLVVAVVGLSSTWLVYSTVRQQGRRNESHSFGSYATMSPLHRKRSRAVASQAIWYTASFLNAMFCIVLVAVLGSYSAKILGEDGTSDRLADNLVLYACVLLFYMLGPLQGFLNWLIYIRPRWIPWRDAYADKSRWWALCQVMAGRPTPVTPPTQHWLAVDSTDINPSMQDPEGS